MASSTAPSHDFAPAWLKIPSNSQKSSIAANNDQSLSTTPSSHVSSHLTSRNSSVESRRERGRSGFPFRHHSIDADDFQRQKPTHSNNGSDYSLASGYKQHSGSQPSLGRRSNSRQDFRDNSFPNKISNWFEGDSHRPSNSHWGRQRSFERNHGGSSSGHNGRNSSFTDQEHSESSPNWGGEKPNKFDQEFPSLKGDKAGDEPATTATANTSVWDMSGKIHLTSSSTGRKIHLVQKSLNKEISLRNSSPNGTNGNTSPKSTVAAAAIKQPMKLNSGSNVTSVFRTLIPTKGLRRTVNDSVKSNGQIHKTDSSQCLATQMEKLNTRLVTHPKNVGNKSEFLKELRDDNGFQLHDEKHFSECDYKPLVSDEDIDSHKNPMVNGSEQNDESYGELNGQILEQISDEINGLDIYHENVNNEGMVESVLSRSLEAEQRLLREMGWKEEGEDCEGLYAPLTEDEVKEFRNLPKQQLPKRNNDLSRSFQFTWSPKRVLNIPPAALDIGNDISSSTSSDSESD